MKNKKIFLSIFLILCFISISTVSAHDNSTDLENIIEVADNVKEIEFKKSSI